MLPHFMSIVALEGMRVVGYESLLRLRNSATSPAELFSRAERNGRTVELDIRALGATLRDCTKLDGRLFINVDPRTLQRPDALLGVLSAAASDGFSLERLTVEITEQAELDLNPRTLQMLRTLRQTGVELALDDIDVNAANLEHLAALRPRYLKLSSEIGRSLQSSKASRDVVALAAAIATQHHSELIVEGLETARDVEITRELGAHLGQGYHFGRPASAAAITGLSLAA
jgi:EAL domain-containing protein (putative c-di-GMP-specific phosphodiesterase class I)